MPEIPSPSGTVMLPGGTVAPLHDERPVRALERFARLIARRGWIFAVTAFAVVALVAIGTILAPKTYTAQVRLIAGNVSTGPLRAPSDTALPFLNALLAQSGVQSAETYAELLQERPIAEQVMRRAGIRGSPEMFLSHITVAPINNTSILRVSVSWSNPADATKLANLVADVFIARQRELIASQGSQALDFISAQLPQAASRLQKADRALAQYQTSQGLADTPAQTQVTIAAMSTLDQKLSQVQVDRDQARAQLDSLAVQLARMSPTIVGGSDVSQNPLRAQLQTQLATVEVQLQTARQQYSAEHPTVANLARQETQLRRQIAALPATVVSRTSIAPNPVYQQLNQLASQYRSQVAAGTAQIAELQRQRAALRPRLAALPQQNATVVALQRERKLADDGYTALQQRFNDALLARSAALSDVTVTQPASLRSVAVAPSLRFNLMVAFAVGTILGIVAMFLLDMFDNRVKEDADVSREFGLAQLGSVPRLPKSGSRGDNALARAASVEAFVDLVTALRYSSVQRLQVIAMISAAEKEGKTTTCINTGLTLAEIDPRVLIVDADLRVASLHTALGVPRGRGVSDVLVGSSTIDDVIVRTKHPSLDVLTAGTHVPNASKLLQSQAFDELIASLRGRYKTILLDCPAVNPVMDGAVVALRADGSVLIVAEGKTEIPSLAHALRRLESVGLRNVLGYVLNFATHRREATDYFAIAESNGQSSEHLVLTS